MELEYTTSYSWRGNEATWIALYHTDRNSDDMVLSCAVHHRSPLAAALLEPPLHPSREAAPSIEETVDHCGIAVFVAWPLSCLVWAAGLTLQPFVKHVTGSACNLRKRICKTSQRLARAASCSAMTREMIDHEKHSFNQLVWTANGLSPQTS